MRILLFRLTLAALLVLGLVACETTAGLEPGDVLTPTITPEPSASPPDEAGELPERLSPSVASPESDWREVRAGAFSSQPGFSLRLPPGWELNELQGIDSYVGEVVGDGVRLTFDYGAYSWTLDPGEDPEYRYSVAYEEIGGVEAKLLWPRGSSGGSTGVYFQRLGGPSFNLVVEDLTREQQRVAFGIFRSVRSLANGHLQAEISGLDEGDTARLLLERRAPASDDTTIVRTIRGLANEMWAEPIQLTPGNYRLTAESGGYLNSPVAYTFTVPEQGVTWQHNFSFQFFGADENGSATGVRLCESATSTATPRPREREGETPCRVVALPTVMLGSPGMKGVISGLPDGTSATVRIRKLPDVDGECYYRPSYPAPECAYPEDVTAVKTPPGLTPGATVATVEVDNGVWGLIDRSLANGRYLVTVDGDTAVAETYVVVVFGGKLPRVAEGVDFTLGNP